jgi:hypothetical protein
MALLFNIAKNHLQGNFCIDKARKNDIMKKGEIQKNRRI